jgi:hypothetical protein
MKRIIFLFAGIVLIVVAIIVSQSGGTVIINHLKPAILPYMQSLVSLVCWDSSFY